MTAYKYQTKKGIRWEYLTNYVDYDGKKRQKHQQGFKTKKEALEAERVFLTTKRFDTDTPLRAMVDIYKQQFDKSNTLHSINVMLGRFESFLDIPISSITEEMVRDHLKRMDVSATSKNAYSKTFCMFYNWSAKRCNIPSTIFVSFKAPKRDYKIYTLEEYQLFRSHLNDFCRPFFDLLYYTGLRKGEALALTRSDITDFVSVSKSIDDKGIVSSPKTPTSVRKVALPAFLKEELDDLMQRHEADRLFPVNYYYFKKFQIRAEKEANLHHIRMHDFRHSHASYLIANDVNVADVSHRLGHASIGITLNTYAHLYNDRERDIANLIEKSVRNP